MSESSERASSCEIQKLVQLLVLQLAESTVAWKCGMTEAYATRSGRQKTAIRTHRIGNMGVARSSKHSKSRHEHELLRLM
eukprot:7395226-Pyramimonas_sp.AAC.1